MAVRIQFRRDDAATWTAVNPILSEGELGLETDTGKFKVGNGVDYWNALAYSSGPAGPIGTGGQPVLIEPESPDEPFVFPGPQGVQGITGIGVMGPPGFDGSDPDEPMMIPGNTGKGGDPGSMVPIMIETMEADEPMPIPGPAGPQGQGLIGPSWIELLEPDEPITIPGPPGIDGVSAPVIPGQDGEDPDEPFYVPGRDGLDGVGINGLDGAQPDDLLALLAYAFKRIDFLEQSLRIFYGPKDIDIPQEMELLQ